MALCWLEGTCRKDIVEAIRRKLEKIDIDAVPDSSYLTRFLSDRPYSLVKQVGTTCLLYTSSLRGLTILRYGIPYLEVSFTLRCFQRLSAPHFATLPCRWRDNRCTIGASIPVLSY